MRKNLILVVILLFAVSLTFMWARGAEEDADAEAAAANFNATGLPIVNEPVTYTVAYNKYANDQSSSQAEKECVLFTEEKTNVKLEFIEIMHTAWSEKVNLLFASGDLPDAFFGEVPVGTRKESLAELGPLIGQYAPNITNLFEIRPDLKKMVTAPDGKIYSIPTGEEAAFLRPRNLMWLNKVWLEKVGLPLPKTLDEFETVLRAFKTQDPNGNGKQDEIPFTCYMEGSRSLYHPFGAFGVPTDKNYLMVQNGKVIFTPREQGFYEGLVWYNKMVSDGLIDEETFTQTIQEYRAKAGSEEMIIGGMYDIAIYNAVGKDAYDIFQFVPYQLEGPHGDALWRVNPGSSPTSGGMNEDRFTVSSDAAKPETLVRWVDYINSSKELKLLWSYSDRETGLWKVHPDEGTWEAVVPPDLAMSFGVARYTTAAPAAPVFLPEEDNRDFSNNKTLPLIEASRAMRESNEVEEWIPAGIWKPDNQKKVQILFADIDNYMQGFIANAALDGISEDQWENHLNQCEKLRIDEYVELYQDFYDRVMSQ
jgi:putative aldouronate transport system substrate-binding protein